MKEQMNFYVNEVFVHEMLLPEAGNGFHEQIYILCTKLFQWVWWKVFVETLMHAVYIFYSNRDSTITNLSCNHRVTQGDPVHKSFPVKCSAPSFKSWFFRDDIF